MHRIAQRILAIPLSLSLILGSFRGYVALFDDSCQEPRQIYPYQVAALPPADQAALDKGIPIRSEKQLQHMLEDYLS